MANWYQVGTSFLFWSKFMETLPLSEFRETFILRLWRDKGNNCQWRGHIQCVSNGEVVALLGTANIFDYLQSQLDKQVSKHETKKGLR
jgi:hypothetical protein